MYASSIGPYESIISFLPLSRKRLMWYYNHPAGQAGGVFKFLSTAILDFIP